MKLSPVVTTAIVISLAHFTISTTESSTSSQLDERRHDDESLLGGIIRSNNKEHASLFDNKSHRRGVKLRPWGKYAAIQDFSEWYNANVTLSSGRMFQVIEQIPHDASAFT